MTSGGRPSDAGKQFEQELRDVVAQFNPVPEAVKSRARRAAQLRSPGASELLDLVYDSVLDGEIAVLPEETVVRLLAFSGGGVRLELKVDTDDAGACRLTGWVVPVTATAVALRTEDATAELPRRDDGSFSANDVRGTHVSVVVEVPLNGTDRRFHSSWFAL